MARLFESVLGSSAESAPQGSEKVVIIKRVSDDTGEMSWVERTPARQMPLSDAVSSLADKGPYWESLIGSQGARKDVSAVILLDVDNRQPLLRWSTKTHNHDLLYDADDSTLVPTAGLDIQSVQGKRLVYIEGCDGNNRYAADETDAAQGVMRLLSFVTEAIPNDQDIDIIATDQAGNEFVNTRGDLPENLPNQTVIEKVRANS